MVKGHVVMVYHCVLGQRGESPVVPQTQVAPARGEELVCLWEDSEELL